MIVTSILTAEPPLSLLLSVASPDTDLNEKTRKLMEDSKRAIMSSWVPQKVVLAHPATAIFVVSLLDRSSSWLEG